MERSTRRGKRVRLVITPPNTASPKPLLNTDMETVTYVIAGATK
jgi:hypothetical protein